jgi:DNA-binding NarL/FixJ family response regulator
VERAPSPLPGPDHDGEARYLLDLTEREVEVLRLVAQGLTDPQVAAQLSISPRTVHAHLRTIFGKLAVTTRSAATRLAVASGLA